MCVGSSKQGPPQVEVMCTLSRRWGIGRAAPGTRWVDAGSSPARRFKKIRGLPQTRSAPFVGHLARCINNPVRAIEPDLSRISEKVTDKEHEVKFYGRAAQVLLLLLVLSKFLVQRGNSVFVPSLILGTQLSLFLQFSAQRFKCVISDVLYPFGKMVYLNPFIQQLRSRSVIRILRLRVVVERVIGKDVSVPINGNMFWRLFAHDDVSPIYVKITYISGILKTWPSSPSNGEQLLAYDGAESLGTEAVTVDTGGSCGPSGGSSPSSAIIYADIVKRYHGVPKAYTDGISIIPVRVA